VAKRDTDRILKEASKPIPKASMEHIADTMEKIMRHKSGIYALYNNDELYYVGKTQNLRARIKDHIRYTDKWNKFRIFLIDKKHLPDVETIVLTIAKPKGNKKGGILPKRGQLDRIIRKAFAEKAREAHDLKQAFS
jgi:hypothetical protein